MSRLLLLGLLLSAPAWALDLCLPTGNDALLRARDAEFFQPTVEGTVESGMFGCGRRGGNRFHEGVDIKCLRRDRRGEPLDSVHAVSAGEVAFINTKPGLSNYGRYVVLAHRWDGVEVYTLYAHLSAVEQGLVVGQPVARAQVIGTLGHSSNTREGIPAERAHLHFEINLLLNTGFRVWYPRRDAHAPPFGNFNGKNLSGIDPGVFLRAYAANRKLNFADYLARQPVAFTVLVGARPFPWLAMHPEQVRATTGTPVAYEVGATAWGTPLAVWPRTTGELTDAQRRTLQRGTAVVSRVNETEMARGGCRRLIERAGSGWRLGEAGREWVELLTFP